MKRALLSVTAAAAFAPLAMMATPAAAQAALSTAPVVAAGNSVLTISAEGKTTRTPDLAVFNAGVTTQGKTAGEALSENAAKMNAVIAALKRTGIADRDIQTSNLSVNPVYGQPKRLPDGSIEQQEPVIIGYQATNQVSVRQRKIDQYGKVIDTLVAAGANQVNGPSFQLDNADAATDEARVDAAGLRVVRVLTISESGGWSPPAPVLYARADKMMAAAAPSSVAAGELDVGASVTVTYELAP